MKIIKNSKGFTLTELVIVLVIIGILVAIAIPVYQNVTCQAVANVLKVNVRSTKIFVFNSIGDYDDDHFFDDDYDAMDTLAKHLEIELERFNTPDENNDYDNKHSFQNPGTDNPISDSKVILHYKSVAGVRTLYGGTVKNPAIFITSDVKCDPTNLALSDDERDCLKGTIIIHLKNNQLPIYVYAIGEDGDLLEDSYEEVYR